MFPLYDEQSKKIYFWSFKCGCTFIRDVFYNHHLKLNYDKNYIKRISFFNRYDSLDLQKISEYKKIFICRNPYSRILSCFIDKYIDGYFTLFLNLNIKIINSTNYFLNKEYIDFSFTHFIDLVYDKLVLNKYTLLELDHITPQFSINYNDDFVFDKIYKLEELNNSTFLKDEFNIENNIENNFTHNTNCSKSTNIIKNAFDLNYDSLLELKNNKNIPHYSCFYNEDIKKKIDEIYLKDFETLKKYNIFYNIEYI